jgi:hypothetical protein
MELCHISIRRSFGNGLPQKNFAILVLIFGLNERPVSNHVPILTGSVGELFHSFALMKAWKIDQCSPPSLPSGTWI